jgi:hypothetical protein
VSGEDDAVRNAEGRGVLRERPACVFEPEAADDDEGIPVA